MVEVIGIDNHYSLIRYIFNCDCKKLHSTSPFSVCPLLFFHKNLMLASLVTSYKYAPGLACKCWNIMKKKLGKGKHSSFFSMPKNTGEKKVS